MQLKKLMPDSKFQTNLHPCIKFLTRFLKRIFHLIGVINSIEKKKKSKCQKGSKQEIKIIKSYGQNQPWLQNILAKSHQ